jgi:hypothetical protein
MVPHQELHPSYLQLIAKKLLTSMGICNYTKYFTLQYLIINRIIMGHSRKYFTTPSCKKICSYYPWLFSDKLTL